MLALSAALSPGVTAGLGHVCELFNASIVLLCDLVELSAAPFVFRCSTLVQPLNRSMALARPEPVPTYCLSAISW